MGSSLSTENPQPQGPFYPGPADIFVVRAMLNKAFQLPPDVVDTVFDYAEYWARSTNEIDYNVEHKSPLKIAGSSRMENRFLIRSFPVGLTGFKDKKNLAEELSYDLNEPKPLPLVAEHEPAYFTKLANYPTPTLSNPVRKVVFSIKSHDQGWGGERGCKGTYKGSWTWFEAGLERFDASQKCESQCPNDLRYESAKSIEPALPLCSLRPVQPPMIEERPPNTEDDKGTTYQYKHATHQRPAWMIKANKVATREFQEHVVEWRWTDNINPESEEAEELATVHGRGSGTGDGSFVRGLRIGDVISIWGMARFPGWSNVVEKVKVDIYWAL